MQSSKIIDVTRSFIPVDANAYPQNLHSTEGEDYPEKRIPVVPYMGHNFMPTSYGYKSYFGTNSKLQINSLAPNKPQHVFIFQNQMYKNVLVALCDTGIWVKDGGATGAWTQLVALAALADNVYYEWTFTVIKNVLYAFRNNGVAYYKIETDMSAAGVAITPVVPTFITIGAQLGIFRIGGRLAFWDGTNAIAWSSADVLSDFTPAVLTGANVTTFNSVTGKISAIRTHGRHAIVYASKSITLLEVNAGETFLVKASPIISKSGVAYMHQSVAASPDTIHFAYTDSGIYKIENGKEDLIVPEVFDYLKTYTDSPVYLALMQGRFLCFEILDPRALDGKALFSRVELPPSFLPLPVDSLEDLVIADADAVNMCQAIHMLTQDDGGFAEQKTDIDTAVPPEDRAPGTSVKPIYTCYISDTSGDVPDDLTWTNVPCGVGTFKPSPSTNAGKVSQMTTTSANKTAKTGTDVWVDGAWTMERFVKYQSAIWKRQEKKIRAYIDKILARSESAQVNSPPAGSCAAAPYSEAFCTIGRYPTKFSDYKFGFNKCSFWLTRYVLAASDIKNKYTVTETCEVIPNQATNGYVLTTNTVGGIGAPPGTVMAQTGTLDSIADAAVAARNAAYIAAYGPGPSTQQVVKTSAAYNFGTKTITVTGYQCADGTCTTGTLVGIASVGNVWPGCAAGYTATDTGGGVIACVPNLPYTKKTSSTSNNNETVLDPGVLGVETAYCELSGYEWYDKTGAKRFTPSSTCMVTDDKYPGSSPGSVTRQVPPDAERPNLVDPATGEMCGFPFESTLGNDVDWEDQTVEYPGSGFLLQSGSIAPPYPTKYGAFVYDLHLKKWGKIKMEYKQLLDYSAINGAEGSPISFDAFGMLAGTVKADGYIYLFDNDPADSLLTWGKIGYYRAGFTDLQEIRVDFASLSKGSVKVDVSLDGSAIASDLSYTENFNGRTVTVHPPYDGKWFNISLQGKWDVSYMEPMGLKKGRR